MKTQFNSLTSFAERIEQIEKTKNDYMAKNSDYVMTADNSLNIRGIGDFNLTSYAEGQVADKFSIPRKYYEQTKQIPGLTAMNVNAWLEKEPTEKRMIRTLDGNIRAYLSDRFKPLDNYDILMQSIFPVFEPMMSEIEMKSMVLSDTKMYLQFIFKKFQAEVRKGEVIAYGGTLSNSEVGAGSLNAEAWLHYYICDNGAIRQSIFKKYHVGKQATQDENYNIWKNDTLQAELKSYQLRLRDVMTATYTKENFELEIARIHGAISDKVTNITDTVQNVTKRFGLTETDGKSIIQDMVERNSITRWGVVNGITQLAHRLDNVDRQYQLEKLGGEILDIKDAEWSFLNAA
jgi:hypothetical protein